MAVLWIGFCFLVFLGLDIWNHHRQKKVKHKKVNWWFIAFEVLVVVGCFGWWLINGNYPLTYSRRLK